MENLKHSQKRKKVIKNSNIFLHTKHSFWSITYFLWRSDHCYSFTVPSILSHWLGIFWNIVIITNIFTFSIIMNRWTCCWCWTCHISIMAMYLQKKSVNGIWSCFCAGKLFFFLFHFQLYLVWLSVLLLAFVLYLNYDFLSFIITVFFLLLCFL